MDENFVTQVPQQQSGNISAQNQHQKLAFPMLSICKSKQLLVSSIKSSVYFFRSYEALRLLVGVNTNAQLRKVSQLYFDNQLLLTNNSKKQLDVIGAMQNARTLVERISYDKDQNYIDIL